MNTWLKFQIDYLERELHHTFSKKDIEFLSFYLMLSKKEQKVFNKICNKVKKWKTSQHK